MYKTALAALCAALICSTGPARADVLGSLGAAQYMAVTNGVAISVAAGCVCTVGVEWSFNGGDSYSGDSANPPFIMPLAGNSASGALAVPLGATNVRAIITAYTSGSTNVTLWQTAGPSVSRASASGTLSAATADVTSATGNFVAIPIDPTRWASATFTLTASAFAGTAIWDMMINGQWVVAPYAALTSTVAANPSTVASVAYTTTAADTWDLPLPGNVTQVRVRCSAYTSGSVSVTVSPGRPYVPGVPVKATLFDVSQAMDVTELDTGVLEMSGWRKVAVSIHTAGAAVIAENMVLQIDQQALA